MVLMIDNYDSFTYNIVQYCLELGADLVVKRNDEVDVETILALNPKKIIISPGPATPDQAGVSLDVIRYFKDKNMPVLGICLGHQCIAQAYGGKIIRAKNLMHGKTSQIRITEPSTPVFKNLPVEFTATRYHSLVVDQENLPSSIKPTAYSRDDHEIMALEVIGAPIYGLQFHPESIMSQYGHDMIENFLKF